MKILLILSLSILIAAEYGDLDTEWEEFKIKYNRTYPSDLEEEYRKQVFAEHLEQIKENNIKFELGEEQQKMSIAFYCDLTYKEFADTFSVKTTRKQPHAGGLDAPPENLYKNNETFKLNI